MITPALGWLAAALPLAGFASYVRDTLRGRARPDLVSWSLWAATPLIDAAAEIAQHVGPGTVLVTLALGAGPALVVLAALASRHADRWRLTRLSLACGTVSALALALWAATGRGDAAIVLATASDALAAVPTIAKSWSDPGSESPGTYLASGAGGAITLLTGRHWSLASAGFPAYVVTVCAVIMILLTVRPLLRGPRREKTLAALAGAAAVPALAAMGLAVFEVTTSVQAHAPGLPAAASARSRPRPHCPQPAQVSPARRERPLRAAPQQVTLPQPPLAPSPGPRPSLSPSPRRPRPSPSSSRTRTPPPTRSPSPHQSSPSPTASPIPTPSSPSPSPTPAPTYTSPTATPSP